jgi:hypothetical protein
VPALVYRRGSPDCWLGLATRSRWPPATPQSSGRRHQLPDTARRFWTSRDSSSMRRMRAMSFSAGRGCSRPTSANVMPRANNGSTASRRRHQDDEVPRPRRCRRGSDGLVAPLLQQLQDQDEERGVAGDLTWAARMPKESTTRPRSYGAGYAFKSMDSDPDIVTAQKAAGYDPDIRALQNATAKARIAAIAAHPATCVDSVTQHVVVGGRATTTLGRSCRGQASSSSTRRSAVVT